MNYLLVTREQAQVGDYYTQRERPITPGELFDRRLDPCCIAWLMVYYDDIMQGGGTWPGVRPEEIPSHSGAHRHGWFEIPVTYCAMMRDRLEKCGFDGVLAWFYYHGDEEGKLWETEELARRFHYPEQSIIRRINSCLRYCSGWKERRRTYKEFTSQHKNRAKCRIT